MAIKFTCSYCGAPIAVPENLAGVEGECPKCGKLVRVPAQNGGDEVTFINPPRQRTAGGMLYHCQSCGRELPGASAKCPHCDEGKQDAFEYEIPATTDSLEMFAQPAAPVEPPVCIPAPAPAMQSAPQSVAPTATLPPRPAAPPAPAPTNTGPAPSAKFCSGCGSPLQPGGRCCAMCGVLVPGAGLVAPMPTMPIAYANTGQNIWTAFLSFATDPIGGIEKSSEIVGTKTATAGLLFALVFTLLIVLASRIISIPALQINWFVVFLAAAILFAGLLLSSIIIRAIFHGEGSIDGDVFFAGIALLPAGIGALLIGIFYQASIILTIPVYPFLCSYSFLALYGGLKNILKIPEHKITYALPLLLIFWSIISGLALLLLGVIAGVSALEHSSYRY